MLPNQANAHHLIQRQWYTGSYQKGFIDWLKTDPADIICLQETKANSHEVNMSEIEKLGYHHYWFSAQKGYSGVAVFTKIKPVEVITGNGHTASDDEGRVIQLDFGKFRLINAYFPSGTSGDIRRDFKYAWLDELFSWLEKQKKKYPNLILCGDYNIAHKEIDIHDQKGNKNSSGFLPDERKWMDTFLTCMAGWILSGNIIPSPPLFLVEPAFPQCTSQ